MLTLYHGASAVCAAKVRVTLAERKSLDGAVGDERGRDSDTDRLALAEHERFASSIAIGVSLAGRLTVRVGERDGLALGLNERLAKRHGLGLGLTLALGDADFLPLGLAQRGNDAVRSALGERDECERGRVAERDAFSERLA